MVRHPNRRLTTTEILYPMPGHPALRQSFVWQKHDLAPAFPELTLFLDCWKREIEGALHSVCVANAALIKPAELRCANGVFCCIEAPVERVRSSRFPTLMPPIDGRLATNLLLHRPEADSAPAVPIADLTGFDPAASAAAMTRRLGLGRRGKGGHRRDDSGQAGKQQTPTFHVTRCPYARSW